MRLIDQLLKGGKAALDAAKRPFIISKLERSFESARDSAKESIVDQELKIRNYRAAFTEDPEKAEATLNSIIKCKEEIRKCQRTIEIVEEERKALFEEEVEKE